MRKRSIFICLILTLVLVLGSALPAWAWRYYVTGVENQDSDPGPGYSRRWTGGHSYNRVMNSPTINYAHVNSIYMRRGDTNAYEVGWYWYGASNPRNPKGDPYLFAVVVQDGVYSEWPKPADENNAPRTYRATRGENYLFSAQVDTNETGAPARLKVNSTVLYDSRRDQSRAGLFPDGEIVWGAEREVKTETNYGWWWHLMKRRHDFSWVLWQNQGGYGDTDNAGDPPGTNGFIKHEVTEYEAHSQPE